MDDLRETFNSTRETLMMITGFFFILKTSYWKVQFSRLNQAETMIQVKYKPSASHNIDQTLTNNIMLNGPVLWTERMFSCVAPVTPSKVRETSCGESSCAITSNSSTIYIWKFNFNIEWDNLLNSQSNRKQCIAHNFTSKLFYLFFFSSAYLIKKSEEIILKTYLW